MSNLLRDIKYLFFSKLTTVTFGLLTTILLARELGPELNGKIILVPTRAIEFISIDFVITNAGVEFP